MMDRPLQLKSLLWRAERIFGDKKIVTRVDDSFVSYSYADYGRRVRRLASALSELGVSPGDRVGTLCWNTFEHYEAYFAVPCIGAVLHTINTRLSCEQISYIINHARDKVLIISPDQVPTVERMGDALSSVETFIILGFPSASASRLRSTQIYEDLIASGDENFDLQDIDERSAAGMCYTSGTTGEPKGVLYSHRSTVLHALMLCLNGSIGVSESERYLLVTPMSHVNSWGMPFACALQGATLVLPGVQPRPADYLKAIEHESVSVCVAAVSVGMLMREEIESNTRTYDLSSLKTLWLGGQAPPVSEMRWWNDRYHTEVVQGWGMTESSPLLTFTTLKDKFLHASEEERYKLLSRQGLPLPLVEMKVVNDRGEEQPWDAQSAGEILVRSPWVARSYYNDPRSQESFQDGWFRTGDVGHIDPEGYLSLVDRTKDLIKSGGEWISSVDLENALMAHPAVREAAVVAVADPTWLERPVAYVSTRSPVEASELAGLVLSRFPKFWVPDQFIFVDEVPKTSVGKFDKKALRQRLASLEESVTTDASLPG